MIPTRRPRVVRALLAATTVVSCLALAEPAQAATYKCVGASGRTEYADHPCNGDPGARPWQPKRPINVLGSEAFTGRKAEPADRRPAWLKGPDPIGDCKRKGGTIDPELRACVLP